MKSDEKVRLEAPKTSEKPKSKSLFYEGFTSAQNRYSGVFREKTHNLCEISLKEK
jgi:hypothetical protein